MFKSNTARKVKRVFAMLLAVVIVFATTPSSTFVSHASNGGTEISESVTSLNDDTSLDENSGQDEKQELDAILDGEGGDLEESDLEESDLEEGDLEEGDLEEGNLEESDLEEGDLEEGDLGEGNLEDDDFEEGNLEDDDLEGDDLEDGNLEDDDLEGDDLEDGNLGDDDLEGDDLEDGDLGDDDLEGDDLEDGNLGDDDLEDDELEDDENDEPSKPVAVISFAEGTLTAKYGDTFSFKATGENELEADQYTSSDTSVATVDEAGNVTVVGVGTTTITATISETDEYLAGTASYELVVEKADQSIGFELPEYTLITGAEFTEPIAYEFGDASGSGEISYSIKLDPSGVVETLNDATGDIVFTNNAGEVVILATKAACDYFNEATAEYVLKVTEWEPDTQTYTISGAKGDGEWYVGNVSVEAEEGYSLSYSKGVDAGWQETLSNAAAENGTNTISFYVREISTGYISKINVETVMLDKENPSVSIAADEIPIWQKLLTIIGINQWNKGDEKFTITAADTVSGIDENNSVWYYIEEGTASVKTESDIAAIDGWQKYEGSVAVPKADKQFVVYAKVVDNAGNPGYASTNGIIFERTKPEIVHQISTEATAEYYNQDVEIQLNVSDSSVSSGIAEIKYWIKCDEEVKPETIISIDEQLNNDVEKTITINAQENNSDNVKVFVEATDYAGNVSETTVIELKINATAPVVEISSVDDDVNPNTRDERGYFDANRTLVFTITERNSTFEANEAKEVIKNALTADVQDLNIDWDGLTWGSNPDSTDEHFLTVPLTVDANYIIDETALVYTNKAGTPSADVVVDEECKFPYCFTIDKAAPTGKVWFDNGDPWEALIETLTFDLTGLNDLTVNISAEDATSGVDVYYYISDKVEALSPEELNALDENDSWILYDYDDENPLQIVKDQRLACYAKVVDYAGNQVLLSSDGYIVDKTAPKIKFEVESEEVAEHNGVKVYNDDVYVRIDATELFNEDGFVDEIIDENDIIDYYYSGIQRVEYQVVKTVGEDRIVTYPEQSEQPDADPTTAVIYEYNAGEDNKSSFSELKALFSETIKVVANDNNACDVKVIVTVTDRAGNVTTEELQLDIDTIAPVIEITYDDVECQNELDGREYYQAPRTATVKITERTGHFSDANATANINIEAKNSANETIVLTDSEGNTAPFVYTDIIQSYYYDSENPELSNYGWITEEDTNGNPDAAVHTAVINYIHDANYTFSIEYTDLAGNSFGGNNDTAKGSVEGEPYLFTVDTHKPVAKIRVQNIKGSELEWNQFIKNFKFGLWDNKEVEIFGFVSDETSPIKSVEYYKTDSKTALTVDELNQLNGWCTYAEIAQELEEDADSLLSIAPNERFTIYKKVVDYANKTTYVSTDGIVLDDIAPNVSISLPASNNGIYNGDVNFSVHVEDPKYSNDVYSGINSITCEVYSGTSQTQNKLLYAYVPSAENWKYDELQTSINVDYTVEAASNNSNDVRIVVTATDNAGNQSSQSVDIKIDITKPVIEVAYDNNAGDTSFGDTAFFKENRIATITIKERNFSAGDVAINITNEHGVQPVISDWTVTGGTGDGTLNTATVVFSEDGDYTFDISCYDIAGNPNEDVDYGASLAPQKFTVDKTQPVIEVSYDNNASKNGNYYDAERVATITLREHNFETSRVQIRMTATDNGNAIAVPVVSGWSSYGDVHTATIRFASDALYSFDIDYTDKAGNESADHAEQKFYVDTINPTVEISQIQDQSANNSEGNIGFVITAKDTNFDVFKPVLSVVVKNGEKFETKQVEVGEVTSIANGNVYTVKNLEADGIYSIKCTVVDKAGNEYSEVTLYDKNGNPYVEKRFGEDTLLMFSVNRDGSTYNIDDVTAAVLDKYYVRNVANDLTIIEINTDILDSYAITLNGKELSEGSDYSVVQEGGDGQWVKYSYIIKKELFENEGEYRIIVASKDKAGNDAFSDVKDASVVFVVDKTAPVVTVSGLATDGRYQVEKQLVTVIPSDDGGELRSLIIRLIDKDGNVIKELINLVGDALTDTLAANGGMITFEIEEGLFQNVQILCEDCSTDDNGAANITDDVYADVSVSTSAVKILWANRPLRYGIMTGLAGIFTMSGAGFAYKRKKKVVKSAAE